MLVKNGASDRHFMYIQLPQCGGGGNYIKMAEVNVVSIGLTFAFLKCNINNHKYNIREMENS